MKRLTPLLVVFAAGLAASFALASPNPGRAPSTSASTSTSPGKSGDHGSKGKCRPLNLKGTVTRIEWANPHIWVYLDVKNDEGVQPWQCEGGPPNTLTRNGWTKDSLKVGDQVTIDGVLAKDGSKTCNARLVKLPDGRSVFAGSSGDTQQRQP